YPGTHRPARRPGQPVARRRLHRTPQPARRLTSHRSPPSCFEHRQGLGVVVSTRIEDLPVVVIGAGPVGLAAAAHLHERGLPFTVLEAGDAPAAAVRQWSHVRLFSPWRYNIDAAAR